MHGLKHWLKKYFIPHDQNNYKPHFLRHESAIVVFLFVVIVELAFLIQVFIVFDKTNFLASVLPGVLTALTNEERTQNDASPLVQNELLVKAAELKAKDMATRGYFAHVSPDGKTPWYWLEQVGYKYAMAGENLAVNFFESDDVAEAWMNSPTHRANIVKKNYTEIGIAVASGVYEGKNTVFVAQFFGTPLLVASSVPPTPKTETKKTTPAKPAEIKEKTPEITTPPKTVAVASPTVQVLGEEANPPASINQNENIFLSLISFIEKVLASPRQYVNYIYGAIAFLVASALLLAIFIKREFQHPALIGRGIAIVIIIISLVIVNIKILHFDAEVPAEGLEASVIATGIAN